MHADIALSASCKKCWTAESTSYGVRVCVRRIGIPLSRLPPPFHFKTLWLICMSGCMRYEGNWMAQTLGHMLTLWLLITHEWLRLSSQALHVARPIFAS